MKTVFICCVNVFDAKEDYLAPSTTTQIICYLEGIQFLIK